jgi:hypothetical protein
VRLKQPDQSVPQQEQILTDDTDDNAHRNLDLDDTATAERGEWDKRSRTIEAGPVIVATCVSLCASSLSAQIPASTCGECVTRSARPPMAART